MNRLLRPLRPASFCGNASATQTALSGTFGCRMATALGKTIELQRTLDGLYPQVEDSPLALD